MNTENLAFSEQDANISKPPKPKRSDTDRLKECYDQQKKTSGTADRRKEKVQGH